MFDWMPHLPDAVWGAVVGASIALLTTFLNNRHSRKQLRMQLADNALQRDRDRTISLRRDVYLAAAEAMNRIQTSLGQLTNTDTKPTTIGRELSMNLGFLGKVHLVATEPTVKALMAYQREMGVAFAEVVIMRGALDLKKTGIEAHQKYMDRADAERWKLIDQMKQHNLSGSLDHAAFDRLKDQAEIEKQAFDTHSEQQKTLRQELFAGQMEMGEKSTDLAAKAAAQIPDVLIACREELELPIDADGYRTMFAEQQNAAREVTRQAVRSARKMAGIEQTPIA
jgi:hypothetical protein